MSKLIPGQSKCPKCGADPLSCMAVCISGGYSPSVAACSECGTLLSELELLAEPPKVIAPRRKIDHRAAADRARTFKGMQRRIDELTDALQQAIHWFDDYAYQHKITNKPVHAERNERRAAYLKSILKREPQCEKPNSNTTPSHPNSPHHAPTDHSQGL